MPISFLHNWIENRRIKKAKRNTFTYPEVNWTIQIPVSFSLVTDIEKDIIKSTGEKAIKAINQGYLIIPGSRIAFFAKKDRGNAMCCSITPLEGQSEFEKTRYAREVKELLVERLRAGLPSANIDSGTTVACLGGKEFEDFQVDIQPVNKNLFKVNHYSAEVNGHLLEITAFYWNKAIGEMIMESLKSSIFS